VAELHDWVELGKDTISSLKTKDVTNLYALEWPETRKMLIADYQSKIDNDPRRLRRVARTQSALLLGLARRLAPHRRLFFLIGFVGFFICLGSVLSDNRFHGSQFWPALQLTAMFMIMVVLLAMELIDKIKFRDELELARDLQADLIPKSPPQTNEYEIASFNRIANTVGGDIYDFVQLPDGRLAVLFGDASGHGMAAGLMMAVAHAAFRTQLDVDATPGAIIGSLNRILCRTGGTRSFFSCCYVLVAPDGAYVATIAGHPQILKVDRNGKVIERIGRGSYPLGVKIGISWEQLEGTLGPNELLFFHSDGLTEARNRSDREFGDAYLETVIGWHGGVAAQELVSELVAEWRGFTARAALDDDVSIAVVTRRSPEVDCGVGRPFCFVATPQRRTASLSSWHLASDPPTLQFTPATPHTRGVACVPIDRHRSRRRAAAASATRRANAPAACSWPRFRCAPPTSERGRWRAPDRAPLSERCSPASGMAGHRRGS